MHSKKISIIGSGNIGGTFAHLSILKNLGDIVLFDVVEGLPQGKALDLSQICPIESSDISIRGTNNYEDISGSDVVVVTAGVARKPGMSRDDLLEINAKIMKDVGHGIKNNCPEAFIVCITNPLDVMVEVLQVYAGISNSKIIGMAGVLDSSRFRRLLADEFSVSVEQVQAYVMGGHGDTMVPLTTISNISGISLDRLVQEKKISSERLSEIINRTRLGGGDIVKLLKTGSAYYAPATSAIQMVESYLLNKGMILPCASKLTNGMYGVNDDIFVGVPTKITSEGAFPIEINLTVSEKELLQSSINAVRDLNIAVTKFI